MRAAALVLVIVGCGGSSGSSGSSVTSASGFARLLRNAAPGACHVVGACDAEGSEIRPGGVGSGSCPGFLRLVARGGAQCARRLSSGRARRIEPWPGRGTPRRPPRRARAAPAPASMTTARATTAAPSGERPGAMQFNHSTTILRTKKSRPRRPRRRLARPEHARPQLGTFIAPSRIFRRIRTHWATSVMLFAWLNAGLHTIGGRSIWNRVRPAPRSSPLPGPSSTTPSRSTRRPPPSSAPAPGPTASMGPLPTACPVFDPIHHLPTQQLSAPRRAQTSLSKTGVDRHQLAGRRDEVRRGRADPGVPQGRARDHRRGIIVALSTAGDPVAKVVVLDRLVAAAVATLAVLATTRKSRPTTRKLVVPALAIVFGSMSGVYYGGAGSPVAAMLVYGIYFFSWCKSQDHDRHLRAGRGHPWRARPGHPERRPRRPRRRSD